MTRLQRRLAEQPLCVLCGGAHRAETIDHIPPISVFTERRRPKGLEFVSCRPCNVGASGSDLAAAVLSRIYPNVRPQHAGELRKLTRSVAKRHPGLLEEMWPSADQVRRFGDAAWAPADAHVLNASGPILTRLMNRFIARVGLALHNQLTHRIAPLESAVSVRWFSNAELYGGQYPKEFMALFGPPHTLIQGSWSVADQFLFDSKGTADGHMTVHLASFRQAFAGAALVSEAGWAEGTPAGNVFTPGFLRSS